MSVEATTGRLWGGTAFGRSYAATNDVYRWFEARADEFRAGGDLVWLDNPTGAPVELLGQVGPFKFQRCLSTGFVFANPRLKTERLLEFFASKHAEKYFSEVEGSLDLRRRLSYRPLADYLRSRLPEGARLLEVGCGSGALLEFLRDHAGFTVEGLDLSSAAETYQKRRGLKVWRQAVESFVAAEPYDSVLMWSVMDHYVDPIAALRACRQSLKPHGLILIAGINVEGFDHQVLGFDSGSFTPPSRVNFYGYRSLPAHLALAGFDTVEITTPGQLDIDIVREYWTNGGDQGRHPFLESLILNEAHAKSGAAFQAFLQQECLSGFMLILGRRVD